MKSTIHRTFGKWPWEDESLPRWKRYRLYMVSPHWLLARTVAVNKTRRRCEYCGSSKRLTTHHLTYARLFAEPHTDLMTLCWPCHKKAEGYKEEHEDMWLKRIKILNFLTANFKIKRKADKAASWKSLKNGMKLAKSKLEQAEQRGWFKPWHNNY